MLALYLQNSYNRYEYCYGAVSHHLNILLSNFIYLIICSVSTGFKRESQLPFVHAVKVFFRYIWCAQTCKYGRLLIASMYLQ